ncbi:dethiobiotin synthase [Priestia megaterium]|nr:dethiobiotin synthase [Priestia megaterium]
MGQAYFITGTGTDIGKTIVTSFLYKILSNTGLKVAICKPFQTGYKEEIQGYPDIHWFESKLGVFNSGIYQLTPETSPHLAIRLTNQAVDKQVVITRIKELEKEFDIVLVEGAGGLAVPLIEEETGFYMTKDLIKDADIPIIIVSTSGLGAIHHTATTFSYAKTHGLCVKGLIFNQFDKKSDIHQDNIRTIEKLVDASLLACLPTFSDIDQDLTSYIENLMSNQHFITPLQEVFGYAIHK